MKSIGASASGQFRIGDITINRLGYGAMRITGPGIWGPSPDKHAALATLRRLTELSIEVPEEAKQVEPAVGRVGRYYPDWAKETTGPAVPYVMHCHNCGSVCFVETEYRTGRDRLPALACEACGVIELDEDLGATVEERVSLRWAIVARAVNWRPPSLRDASDVWAMWPRPRLPSLVQ